MNWRQRRPIRGHVGAILLIILSSHDTLVCFRTNKCVFVSLFTNIMRLGNRIRYVGVERDFDKLHVVSGFKWKVTSCLYVQTEFFLYPLIGSIQYRKMNYHIPKTPKRKNKRKTWNYNLRMTHQQEYEKVIVLILFLLFIYLEILMAVINSRLMKQQQKKKLRK